MNLSSVHLINKNISNREQSKRIPPTYFFPDWKMRGKEAMNRLRQKEQPGIYFYIILAAC